MLTEVVMIEDRVLRFEKAKSALKVNDNAVDGRISVCPSVPVGSAAGDIGCAPPGYSHPESGNESFFIHSPQNYVPYYAYHQQTQQYHTFHVPHQAIPIYQVYQPSNRPPVNVVSSPVSIVSSDDLSLSLSSNEIPNKMFVGHLNGELVTQRKLLRYFQRYGHITDIELFKNNLDGSLRLDAFAFISYLKCEQVQEAIKEEDGKEWLGRRIKCCQALKKRVSGNSSPVLENEEDFENIQICLSST